MYLRLIKLVRISFYSNTRVRGISFADSGTLSSTLCVVIKIVFRQNLTQLALFSIFKSVNAHNIKTSVYN